MRQLYISLMLFAMTLLSSQSFAHHSFSATFKGDAPISIAGVVKKYSFRNPHVLVYLEVENADGSTTEWVAEGPSATILTRQGWSKQTLPTGTRIRIDGDSTHDGSPMISLNAAAILNSETGALQQELMADKSQAVGEEIFVPMNLPDTLEDGRPNLSGLWHGKGSPYPSPRDPDVPFNPAGRALQDAIQLEHDPQVFCEPPGVIRQAAMTHYGVRLQQLDDRIVLDYEEYGGHREIYFDDRDAKGVFSHFGDSIARYEGDTLIIETTNLLPDYATAEGNRLSEKATVIQNFKRVDETDYGAMVSMETVVTDPVYLAEPFILSNIKVAVKDQAFIENYCTPPLRERTVVNPLMNFFITSEGLAAEAKNGNLQAANAHCKTLATNVGRGNQEWRAFVSHAVSKSQGADKRINAGPWYNANGLAIAKNLAHLQAGSEWLTKEVMVDERGSAFDESKSSADLYNDGLFYCVAVE